MSQVPNCPKCGSAPADSKPLAEECATVKGGTVIAVQRSFWIRCDAHGWMICDRGPIGHHSTYAKAEFARAFPRKSRQSMRQGLDAAERRRFDLVMDGFVQPSKAELARWFTLKLKLSGAILNMSAVVKTKLVRVSEVIALDADAGRAVASARVQGQSSDTPPALEPQSIRTPLGNL